ncbi:MAG: M3 family metallopeptidase [Terriglobales bacterium]
MSAAMNARIAAALLVVLAVTARAADSVEARLSAKEEQLEQLYAEYWRTDYRIALGEKQLSVLPIKKRIRALVSDPVFFRQLERAKFTDPVLARRRELFLREAIYTNIFADPQLAALVEAIERDEGDIRYQVGEKKLTRAELNNTLAHSPDRNLRRLCWEARSQITAVTGSRIQRAMKMRIALAHRHAHRPFPEFMLEYKGIGSQKALLDSFEQIRAETEAPYRQLLERIRRELKVEKVEPWDLDYFFSTLTGDFEEKLLVPGETWSRIQPLAASLGYDFDRLPVDVKIADITFGGGTYPILYGKEVKILVNKYTGLRFTDTLLHESGHALHYSLSNEPSFLLRGTYAEPFDEGLGQVMALMLYRTEVATRYFGLSAEQARLVQERYRLKNLLDLRETIADSVFEFEAYANPDQDLDALYNRIYSRYIGVEMHGTRPWAFDPFYSTGPIYLQSYVLAEMVGWQVHHALDRKFGRNWDARTGAYLREKFFSRGGLLTLDQIMQEGTGEPLNPRYMIESLKAPVP